MYKAVTPSETDQKETPQLTKLEESLKKADQQAKFLHLQAEVELLWQKVQRSTMNN
jgi:hypothetical protein